MFISHQNIGLFKRPTTWMALIIKRVTPPPMVKVHNNQPMNAESHSLPVFSNLNQPQTKDQLPPVSPVHHVLSPL